MSFSQETEAIEEFSPPPRNLFADTGYALLGVVTSNFALNINERLRNKDYAHMTFELMWDNLSHNNWMWEDGDRFLINQFGHPYQGSTYFASARVNGFNFYESIIFSPFGSLMWEALMEPLPCINDFITTSVGGIALGEMLHRLFLEVKSPSIGARIGRFFISPAGSYNKIFNRLPRESGGGNIYDMSVKTGVEKIFASFSGHQEQANSWYYPGGYVNFNVVYGNPFVQESKTPYKHFELYTGLSTNLASYRAAIISDGYLFSFCPQQTDTAFTSTGLTMHFDFYNATNDVVNNLGYGNIQFSSSAVGWALKHKYIFSENSFLEAKAHAAFVFWGNSMYNGEYITDDYWVPLGNTRSAYGMGENIKFFFTFFHKKAGKLDFAAHGYHFFSIPVSEKHSTGNVFFVFGSLDYCFPLGKIMGIGVKGNFWGLFSRFNFADNFNRLLVSSALYVRFSL